MNASATILRVVPLATPNSECHAGDFDQAQCMAQRVVRVAECLRDLKVLEDELGLLDAVASRSTA